jgi:hypothetical protein
MPRFAVRASSDRATLIEEASERLNVQPVIVEKDYWVCWTLGRIFTLPGYSGQVVFKGGTSLSKVFGAIRRFSEDVDLSVSPESLGFSEKEIEGILSRTGRAKRFEEVQKACVEYVEGRFGRALEKAILDELGARRGGGSWLEFSIDPKTGSPVLLFAYPAALRVAEGYIQQSIKLEFGSLTDQRPRGTHPIRPLIFEALKTLEPEDESVVALEVERTFWEKATILHAEYHRPASQKIPARFARHYSDMASLWNHPSREAALRDLELLERVVLFKQRFFASGWAHYDSAKPGSLRLHPAASRVEELKRDFNAMEAMFLGEPPIFEDVLAVLRDAEKQLNR